MLLNLSNDGWFHGSSEHDMHLAVSVFRTIENRVPLARAVEHRASRPSSTATARSATSFPA